MARREKGGFWVGLAATLFYPATALVAKRVYVDAAKIPRGGPALLVMNHVSHLDPVVDAVFVHRCKRVPRFLGKESLTRMPVFGKIFTGSGQIPVSRGSAAAGDSLKAAHQALRDGKMVVVYPEGTITKREDGWLDKPFTGAARLALENDIPVIPVARWGTNHVFNGYTKKFTPFPRKTITHLVGDPLDLTEFRGGGPARSATLLREVTTVIMDDITRLLAEIRQEEPPAKED